MSSKTTTDTSNQYNAAGMSAYGAFQPQLQNSLLQMSQNPLASSFFQNQLGMAQAQASQLGQRNISNTLANVRTGGGLIGKSGNFTQSLLNRTMLANSGLQSGAFNSTLNNALQNRNWALSSMQAYQPLQTGQKSTQTTGGVGTWLPQLAGAALGGLTGGLGTAIGGMMGGGGGGGSSVLGSLGQGTWSQMPTSGPVPNLPTGWAGGYAS